MEEEKFLLECTFSEVSPPQVTYTWLRHYRTEKHFTWNSSAGNSLTYFAIMQTFISGKDICIYIKSERGEGEWRTYLIELEKIQQSCCSYASHNSWLSTAALSGLHPLWGWNLSSK